MEVLQNCWNRCRRLWRRVTTDDDAELLPTTQRIRLNCCPRLGLRRDVACLIIASVVVALVVAAVVIKCVPKSRSDEETVPATEETGYDWIDWMLIGLEPTEPSGDQAPDPKSSSERNPGEDGTTTSAPANANASEAPNIDPSHGADNLVTPSEQNFEKSDGTTVVPVNPATESPVPPKEGVHIGGTVLPNKQNDEHTKHDESKGQDESAPKQPKESSPEQPKESSPEQPKESSPEQPKESSPEQPKESSPEQPKESSPEQPKESSPEQPKEYSPEQPKESRPEQPEKRPSTIPAHPFDYDDAKIEPRIDPGAARILLTTPNGEQNIPSGDTTNVATSRTPPPEHTAEDSDIRPTIDSKHPTSEVLERPVPTRNNDDEPTVSPASIPNSSVDVTLGEYSRLLDSSTPCQSECRLENNEANSPITEFSKVFVSSMRALAHEM